jgi:phage tail protein X
MKYLIHGLFVATLFTACTGKKAAKTPEQPQVAVPLPLPDSIDAAINRFEQRLDIKMKRKVYETQPGNLVTLQKWFEHGDTTLLVKLREEIITGTSKMEVIQYHFINNKLAEIHDYVYNKQCGGGEKQCMNEAKYYFAHDTLASAVHRAEEGTANKPPVIEHATFASFVPDRQALKAQQTKFTAINKKYAGLPYPKPRPEKGSPVR